MEFPVYDRKDDVEVCRLLHALFMDVIYHESRQAFYQAVESTETNQYYNGIPVMNTLGEYVPLSWALFYSNEEIKPSSDDTSFPEIGEENHESQNVMEYRHIAVEQYDSDFIHSCETIYEFTDVKDTADQYGIDEDEAMDFYRWVWSYSQHKELAVNILNFLTGSDEQRNTVDEEYNEFVLSVLSHSDIEDNEYCFDIDLHAEKAFAVDELINNIGYSFVNIFPVIYDDHRKLETRGCLDRILRMTQTSYKKKSEIEQDDIWNHVYISKGLIGKYNNKYLKGKIYNEYNDEHYEDAIFLWNSENEDSYVVALAKFVNDYFDEAVDIEAELVDWRKEYNRLANGIKEFLLEKIDRKREEDLYGYHVEMKDIETFGDEKKLWTQLKNQKDTVFSYEGKNLPINLDLWREFLKGKYKGRCQLCGGKTITDEQNAYFESFRIIKPSDNKLADMFSNIFCLCPSCWGELGYGKYMGQDMHELWEKAAAYAEYLEKVLNESLMEDDFPSLVREIREQQELTREEEELLARFHNPIVCRVMVNGKDRCMAFSWNHFIRIAFILRDAGNYEE